MTTGLEATHHAKLDAAARHAVVVQAGNMSLGVNLLVKLTQKVVQALELPDELVDAMDADPELTEAFHALTPGRQRSYVIHLSSAKTSATRVARIEKARPQILAGKGANER